jgi:hypothetical protein
VLFFLATITPALRGGFLNLGGNMNHESWEFFKNIIDVIGLDEKMDIVKDNVMDNKLHFQENMNTCMNTILLEIKKEK